MKESHPPKMCECEHLNHPAEGKIYRLDQNDNHPTHEYMKEFDASEIVVVHTIYGHYQMCKECENHFPKEFRVK